ncbi:MAG: formyltransferase [Syntrophobacterales bacterium]|nr:formyltransferase [Syntrophobacterales bacterium]
MKAVVFAYHEIGYACLDELLSFGAHVSCLFTHEDDPGEEIWFKTPVRLAKERNIPVYTPETLKDPRWADLIRQAKPDVIFSFYYRSLIPKRILEIPGTGAFNVHGSLLPQFRGRCPVNWVLIAGAEKTGLTMHFMEEKPDAGDVVAQRAVDITSDDTAHTLFLKLVNEARPLMRDILPRLLDRTFTRISQSELGPSSYFGGRRPEDGLISWEKDARSVHNLVRAVTHPYPGAFTYFDGKKLFIWQTEVEPRMEIDPAVRKGEIISTNPLVVNAGGKALKLVTVEFDGEREISGEAWAAVYISKNRILGGNA